MEPVLGARLAPLVLAMVRKVWAPPPGAGTVTERVRMGARIPRPRARREVGEDDAARLGTALARRLTDAEPRFARLEPEEGERVLTAVRTLLGASVTMDDVQAAHLEPAALRALLESRTAPDPATDLTGPSSGLYGLLVDECCAQIIEFFSAQPEFGSRTLVEILRRLSPDSPQRAESDAEFAKRYLSGMRGQWDLIRLFGMPATSPEDREYRLTTAFVSLQVRATAYPDDGNALRRLGDPGEAGHVGARGTEGTDAAALEDVLAHSPRLLLEGPAGSGKSTMLRRLALHIADDAVDGVGSALPARLAHWRGRVPFFLRLRSFLTEGRLHLPEVERFVHACGSTVGGEQPPGWASRVLRSGHAVVLIDGVDELPEEHRPEVARWLDQLCADYPDPVYVLTSRPRVLSDDWRRRLAVTGFGSAGMRAMTRAQVREFITRWHEAQALRGADADEAAECGRALDRVLDGRRDLVRLAANPLLCALICALHRNSDQVLPEGRTELYRAALTMLLGAREQARRVSASRVRLQPPQLEKLLGVLAMSMILNGRRSILRTDARERVAEVLPRFPLRTDEDPYTPDEVLRYLVERTGLLQEPEVGVLEFHHAGFQDHLAAAEMMQSGNLDHLVRNSRDPLYHDVLINAVGLTQGAPGRQRRLLNGLISRAEAADRDDARGLWLLAAACIADVGMVDPEPAERIHEATRDLLPPEDTSQAEALATVGEFILDLLADTIRRMELTERQAVAVIRTAEAVASDSAIPVLSLFRHRPEAAVRNALVRTWSRIPDPRRYFADVLGTVRLDDLLLPLPDAGLLDLLTDVGEVTRLALPGNMTHLPGAELARMSPHLVHLEVRNASRIDLSPLAQLPGLRTLRLSGGSLPDLRALAGLGGLDRLELEVTEEARVSLSSLPRSPRVRRLFITECAVIDLEFLSRFTLLTELVIKVPGGADLSPLATLTDLEFLDLVVDGGTDLAPIAALDSLKYLGLIVDGGTDLTALGGLAGLEDLWLVVHGDADLTPLSGLTRLETLRLIVHGDADLTPLRGVTKPADFHLVINGVTRRLP